MHGVPPTFVIQWYSPISALHSFPTRRSSDLSSISVMAGLLSEVTSDESVKKQVAAITTSIAATCFFTLRSEEHTSELQSRLHIVCRPLLEKKNAAPLAPLIPLGRSTAMIVAP